MPMARKACATARWARALAPAEKEFIKLMEETKKKSDSSKIRAAVASLVQSNVVSPVSGERAVPTEVSELPLFAQDGVRFMTSDITGPSGELRGILFLTWSGFGHWGLIVCPSGHDPKLVNHLHGRIVPWENGVSFFLER
jgi:hypothetical protein